MIPTRRVLTLIPAYNEAPSLRTVVADLRRQRGDVDLLVVNDGSTDGTAALLRELNVKWLYWPERRGVGSALRAGFRYAARQGYDVVVRLDADGQHDVNDIARLLIPLSVGAADVVLGSRFSASHRSRHPGPIQRALGALLSIITRRTVTDRRPDSGRSARAPWLCSPSIFPTAIRTRTAPLPEPERDACGGSRRRMARSASRSEFPDSGTSGQSWRPRRPGRDHRAVPRERRGHS